MKKLNIFEKPELEIIEFVAEDIIVTSSEEGNLNDPTPGGTDVFPKQPGGWW